MFTKITYNNGLGSVKVIEKNGQYYISRSAHNRVWKKVTDSLGGLARVDFDADGLVTMVNESTYALMSYEEKMTSKSNL